MSESGTTGGNSNALVPAAVPGGVGAGAEPQLVADLPWGTVKLLAPCIIDPSIHPGHFAAQLLVVEFMQVAERKINVAMCEQPDKHLTKCLQRGEDGQFDNVLRALNGVSEHCLPSVLRAMCLWYDQQMRKSYESMQKARTPTADASKAVKGDYHRDRDFMAERRMLAVDFIFCVVLIEILPQLYLHPGHEEQIAFIMQQAFKQFKYKDSASLGPNLSNSHIIADLYAEVIGVIAQARFSVTRRRFTAELTELRHDRDGGPLTAHNIIGLLMGMKFVRVKTNNLDELEQGISFLHELGVYFLEMKDRDVNRDIKHHIAGLLVEILLPLAAQVKTEANVPTLINFVELLYAHTMDLASKKRHQLAAFPLLTCLLCISQSKFFLNNWHQFLTLTLSHLKSRDPKLSRVALESLYRLLWVYVIRVGCESNTATHSRLTSICSSLFPRGGRTVIPREAPLNIFVKIIHFIAQGKLDFAFKEIIFDLLCVNRPVRTVYPERMNVGMRAFMVIADSLQQKEGPPGMPRSMGPLLSGTMQRVKKTYLTHPLSTDQARNIGLDLYYGPCRRAFDGILRALDREIGRPLMSNLPLMGVKELEEGDRKPKLDLMRTCVAAIPRLMPEGMNRQELIDLLSRMTMHLDEELRGLAAQTLQNLISECADWRADVVHGFLQFIARDIQDAYPKLLEDALRLLLQLLATWKSVVLATKKLESDTEGSKKEEHTTSTTSAQRQTSNNETDMAAVLHCVQGLAVVMLCQEARTPARRIALSILKDTRVMLPVLCASACDREWAVLDALDNATPYVIHKYVQCITAQEKSAWLAVPNLDFVSMHDRMCNLENDPGLVNAERANEYLQWDTWAVALSGFTEPCFLPQQCPTAVNFAWPVVYTRLNACFAYVDPNNPQNDSRGSLLRSSKSKSTALALSGDSLNYQNYLSLWQKYLVLACSLASPALNLTPFVRSLSPINALSDYEPPQLSSISSATNFIARVSSDSSSRAASRVANVTAANLFKWLVPLLRCEMKDMRDIVVLGLGSVNVNSFEVLMDDLLPLLREAGEKKGENIRRRRRRDLLRLQLMRLFEIIALRGALPHTSAIDTTCGALKPVLLEFVDNARSFLESDSERDPTIFQSMRLHFAKMITLFVHCVTPDRRLNMLPNEKKRLLFHLFTTWCSRLGLALDRNRPARDSDSLSWSEQYSVQASCAMLSCGVIFEPMRSIGDEGYLYGWLDALLSAHDNKVAALSEETLAFMLDFNTDTSQLLDWVIDRCYTAPARVADKCFRALATVFSQREYPCDCTSMLVVTVMFSGYPLSDMQQLAVQLFQVLEHRFFADSARDSVVYVDTLSQHALQSTETLHAANQGPTGPGSSAAVSQSTALNTSNDTSTSSNTSAGTQIQQTPVQTQATSTATVPMRAGSAHKQDWTINTLKTTQYKMAQHLARTRPEMTMSILSEVCQRVDNAKPARRACLLRMLVPWLHNIELVNTQLSAGQAPRQLSLSLSTKLAESNAANKRALKADGWGSEPATEMVLNNLMYITVKFDGEHCVLVERLWCALVECWASNMRSIVQYLSVMSIVAAQQILPFAKRIVVYLAKCNHERLVEELINELQIIESFKCDLERTEVPPFYRCNQRMDDTNSQNEHKHTAHNLASSDEEPEPERPSPGLNQSMSMTSLVTLKADILNAKHNQDSHEHSPKSTAGGDGTEPAQQTHLQPFQLPMPPYGGWHAPLDYYLYGAASNKTTNTLSALPNSIYRANLAVLLITDVVMSDIDVDWTVHLPLLLHTATLGLDALESVVHEHCKQLIMHLILTYATQHVPMRHMASVLLANNAAVPQVALATINRHTNTEDKFGTVDSQASTAIVCDSLASSVLDMSRCDTPCIVVHSASPSHTLCSAHVSSLVQHRHQCQHRVLHSLQPMRTVEEAVLTLLQCLSSKLGSVLWPAEDVTSRNWMIGSAQQLDCFVLHLAALFDQLLPSARIHTRWAQTALHVALCASNRHCAGRSFQAFRALRTPPSTRMLSDVLSRLSETVCEQSDDMLQGYVTEILLTLDATIVFMETHEHMQGLDESGDEYLETEDHNPVSAPANQHTAAGAGCANDVKSSPTHARSTSYTSVGVVKHRMSPAVDRRDVRNSACIMTADEFAQQQQHYLPRSKSAQVLRSINEGHDEHLAAMAQLLWIGTALLESDVEHEFVLALRLVDKIICLPDVERHDCLDRLDRMVKQLGWSKFPGLVALVLKGCLFTSAYEMAVNVLAKLVDLLDHSVVDPECGGAVPYIVVTALPLLLAAYDNPTATCVRVADCLSAYCLQRLSVERDTNTNSNSNSANSNATVMGGNNRTVTQPAPGEHPLEHLSTILHLYSRRAFTRDSVQWVRCILKYVHDAGWNTNNPQLLVIVTEVLERSNSQLHLPALQIVYCLFQHIELQTTSPIVINGDVMRAVTKHIHGAHWREAARIMKLTVTRGSVLIAPTVNESGVVIGGALPGRTMEFHLDMSSIIEELCHPAAHKDSSSTNSPRKQANPNTANDNNGNTQTGAMPLAANMSSLRRTTQSQVRVREHLLSLLNATGLRVGLPKSPSVIFSTTSHEQHCEPASSVYSSSGELNSVAGTTVLTERAGSPSPADSGTEYASDSFPRVFKEFDFLEAEHDSVSESADSCFNWMSTLRPRSISQTGSHQSNQQAPTSPEHENTAGSQSPNETDPVSESAAGNTESGSEQATPVCAQSSTALIVHNTNSRRRTLQLPTQFETDDLTTQSDDLSSDEGDVDNEDDFEEHETASSVGGEPEDSGDGRDMQRLFVSTPSTCHSLQMTPSHAHGSVGTEPVDTSLDRGTDRDRDMGCNTPSELGRPLTRSSHCGSGVSLCVSTSTPSMDTAPIAPSFALECVHHATGQIDETWLLAVHDLHNDTDGSPTANATLVYTQLFRDCCSKVSSVLRDCCHYMGMSDTFRGTATEFMQSLDVLMRVNDCPFLFVTAPLLRQTNMLQMQKYALLELREHYETFLERREHCIRLLNCVKSSARLQMLGQRIEHSLFDQRVDLCRAVHKLYFQILMMAECFMKMMQQLTTRLQSTQSQVVNMCADVLCLQRELLCAVNELSASSGRLHAVDTHVHPVALLLRLMHDKQYKGALQHLRYYRNQHGKSDLYGCCEEQDLEVLLLYYCRAAADNLPCSYAVVGSEQAFTGACQQLMETNLLLSSVVRSLQPVRANMRSANSSSQHSLTSASNRSDIM